MKGIFMYVKEWSIIINVVEPALSGIFFNVWHHKQLRTLILGEQSKKSFYKDNSFMILQCNSWKASR